MVFDTPICDSELSEKLRTKAESFNIKDRLERAMEFKSYLAKAWHSSGLSPQYFDWMGFCKNGERSFKKVERVVQAGS